MLYGDRKEWLQRFVPGESIKLEPLHFTVNSEYTVKKVIGFPVPSRDVTNQTLPGGE
jgi:hypothetical protein